MPRALFAGLLLLLWSPLAAQTEEVRYFETSSFGKEKTRSGIYKRTYLREEGYLIVRSYKRDVLLDSGKYLGFSSLENLDHFLGYHEYAQNYLKPRTTFTNREAQIMRFYNAGKPYKLAHFVGDSTAVHQVWTQEGAPLLIDGTGTRETTADNGNTTLAVYTNYQLAEVLRIRPDKGDTIHLRPDTSAKPKSGFKDFHRNLTSNLEYPDEALGNGMETTLYVTFIVDKNGVLREFDLQNRYNESYGFEKKTLKQLNRLEPWIPAYHKGKPVKTTYKLPILFRLTD